MASIRLTLYFKKELKTIIDYGLYNPQNEMFSHFGTKR